MLRELGIPLEQHWGIYLSQTIMKVVSVGHRRRVDEDSYRTLFFSRLRSFSAFAESMRTMSSAKSTATLISGFESSFRAERKTPRANLKFTIISKDSITYLLTIYAILISGSSDCDNKLIKSHWNHNIQLIGLLRFPRMTPNFWQKWRDNSKWHMLRANASPFHSLKAYTGEEFTKDVWLVMASFHACVSGSCHTQNGNILLSIR